MPFPPVASRHARWGVVVFLVSLGIAVPGRAQTPVPTPTPSIPNIAEDEKDFPGMTSLALGSGARAFGMGGAFLARADDATAASWNPAGLSYLRRPEFTVVGARNNFVRKPTQPGETRLIEDSFIGNTPDFAAATYPLDTGPLSGSVQLSLQRVFSFTGDRNVVRADQGLTSSGTGGFDVFALGTGLQVVRSVRLGIAVNRWFNGYHQERRRDAARGVTEQNLDFNLSGWNINAGLIWSPMESLNLGVVGKTTMKGSIVLDRNRLDFIPQPNPEPSPSPAPPVLVQTRNAANSTVLRTDDQPTPHEASVDVSIPGALGVGISWRPKSVLTASLDFTRTFWSKGRIHNFFTLARTEPDQPSPFPTVFQNLPYPTLDDPKQSDTEQLRMGVEYVVLGRRLKLPLRAGFFTDKQYFFDFRGEPPRFLGYTAGIGVAAGPLLLDVAFLRETGSYLDPEADPDDPAARGAERSIRFNRIFVSVIYRYGRGP